MSTVDPTATAAPANRSDSTTPRRRRWRRLAFWALTAIAALVVTPLVYVTQPILGASHRAPPAHAQAARLRADVLRLSTTLAPRDCDHVAGMQRTAEFIAHEFEAAGLAPIFDVFYADGKEYRNVVGSTAVGNEDRIVIGAHYDTCGPIAGADDNASGVAGLMELARMLRAAPERGPFELVAYALEEPPHFRTRAMGSFHHAQRLRENRVKVRAMLCLEMIGYFSDEDGSQDYPIGAMKLFYPSRGDFIAVVGCVGQASLLRTVKRSMVEASDLPVRSMNAPRWIPGIDLSDHLNYWAMGYPAVMVTDTAFYRNKAYHEVGDTPDRLDYGRMALVVDGVFAAISSLGG